MPSTPTTDTMTSTSTSRLASSFNSTQQDTVWAQRSITPESYAASSQTGFTSSSLPTSSSLQPALFPLTARPTQHFSIDEENFDDNDNDRDDYSSSSSSLVADADSSDEHLFRIECDDAIFELDSEVRPDLHVPASLGTLDEALSFLAAERAKWTAGRVPLDSSIKG